MKSASESKVQEAIFSFCCEQDTDIENFLKNTAIRFEKISKSRTYLLVDEVELTRQKFNVLAYFTIALRVLKISDLGLSKTQIKKLDGFSAIKKDEPITDFPVFLVGQIGKNDAFKKSIKGNQVLEYAMSVIGRAQDEVGGRIVLAECDDNPKLIKFYKDNGFIILNTDEMVQLIRIID